VAECVKNAYSRYLPLMERPPAPTLDDYPALIAKGVVTVAVSDEILGILVAWPESDHLYVDNVAVVSQAQGQGVGGRLLETAESLARRHGLDEIRLYTNEVMIDNVGFYQRRGFVETGRLFHEGYHRIFFSKRLSV